MYTRKKIEKNLKKTKKSVEKKGSQWYYIQALERYELTAGNLENDT